MQERSETGLVLPCNKLGVTDQNKRQKLIGPATWLRTSSFSSRDELSTSALVEVGFPGVLLEQLVKTTGGTLRACRGRLRRRIGHPLYLVEPAADGAIDSVGGEKSAEPTTFCIDGELPEAAGVVFATDVVLCGFPRSQMAVSVRVIERDDSLPPTVFEHRGINDNAILKKSLDDVLRGAH